MKIPPDIIFLFRLMFIFWPTQKVATLHSRILRSDLIISEDHKISRRFFFFCLVQNKINISCILGNIKGDIKNELGKGRHFKFLVYVYEDSGCWLRIKLLLRLFLQTFWNMHSLAACTSSLPNCIDKIQQEIFEGMLFPQELYFQVSLVYYQSYYRVKL